MEFNYLMGYNHKILVVINNIHSCTPMELFKNNPKNLYKKTQAGVYFHMQSNNIHKTLY